MRRNPWLWCVLFLAVAVCFPAAQRGGDAAPKPEQLAGVWSGTWDGAGSGGGFELTLEQPKDGPMKGKVSVTGEPAYQATLKTIAFDGKKMTAKYDFPAADSTEITLAATFDGNKCTGTWALHAKAGGDEVASGTFTVTRK